MSPNENPTPLTDAPAEHELTAAELDGVAGGVSSGTRVNPSSGGSFAGGGSSPLAPTSGNASVTARIEGENARKALETGLGSRNRANRR